MFDFLKNFFGKPVEHSNGHEHAFSPSRGEATPTSKPQALPPRFRPAVLPSGRQGNGGGVQIPLQAVLSALPLELKTRVRQSDVGEAVIVVPLEKVLAQLSTGSVKLPLANYAVSHRRFSRLNTTVTTSRFLCR